MPLLEIIAFNIQSAISAEAAGADRLELCENEPAGGTTPSYGFIKEVLQKVSIPAFPMIRPRGGDFCFSADEIEIMFADIKMCKELGCKGIVTGLLDSESNIDFSVLKKLVAFAHPMQVTFHRAFDRARNPLEALEEIIKAGCKRILTSGQMPKATEGIVLLTDLVKSAAGRIIIMPGSGIRSSTISAIVSATQAGEYHSSAASVRKSDIISANKNIYDDYSIPFVDTAEIKEMKRILLSYQ